MFFLFSKFLFLISPAQCDFLCSFGVSLFPVQINELCTLDGSAGEVLSGQIHIGKKNKNSLVRVREAHDFLITLMSADNNLCFM